MKNKIISITEKPIEATLPDGYYIGFWSSNIIELSYNGRDYILDTNEGVRGINVKVVIEIKDGIATFNETLNL